MSKTSIIAALVVVTRMASAQATLQFRDGKTDPHAAKPMLFSISGGISLGAYQAGVNWGLLQTYRTATTDPSVASQFRIPLVQLGSIAGASAGNINTLLWAIEACRQPSEQPPEASTFWQIWTSVGLSELFPRDLRPESSNRALFDRAFFKDSLFKLLSRRLESSELQPDCQVRVGVTLTRARPDTLKIGKLPVLTQRFATAFTARVDAIDPTRRAMRFTWPDSMLQENRRFGRLVFPMEDSAGGSIAKDSIFKIVQAGSAFPVAFQPESLTLFDPVKKAPRTDVYLDGGVFDNNPLGLAIDLFANANPDNILTNGKPDTINLIYVNPGRYRGRLDTLRVRRESALATGGILAAVQVLGGAVETAQQYELQFAARDPKIVRPDSLILRLTSRAHPIVGEHLAHFGAFLARPFREYDFYVGVYDALYFVASEYTCATKPNEQPDYRCIATAIAELIGKKSLTLGSVAPPVLDTLFATEFSGPAFEPQRRWLSASIRWGKTFDDSATTSVLLALHGALQQTQMTAGAASCTNLPLPHMLICSDRLDDLLDRFRETKGVVRTVKQWRQSCEESAKKLEGQARARACESARELNGLVNHPKRYAAQTTDRLFQRLWDVEHRVHRDFKRRADRDSLRKLGIERLDAEVPTAVLLAQYRGRPLRPRYGFEWSTTSAPERARFVHYVVPYYFGFNVGDSGFELGYRPTFHLNHQWGITLPVTSHWTTPVTQTADGVLIGEGKDWYAGLGAGIAGTGVIPRPVGLFLPEFGLTGQYFVPAAGQWAGNGRFVADAYADISLLAGRLRVAGRYTNREDQLFDGGKWAWSVGIADLNGLLYWLTRLQR